MRIIAGRNRSRKLYEPRTMDIRPTTDRTKESLFNIINMDIVESSFLDLYSGSGSVSFEADSRGANNVISVDNSKEAKVCFVKNSEKIENNIKFMNSDVRTFLNTNMAKFDFIFMDPPYSIDEEELYDIISEAKKHLSDSGELILEMSSSRRLALEDVIDKRKYGKSTLYFMKKV